MPGSWRPARHCAFARRGGRELLRSAQFSLSEFTMQYRSGSSRINVALCAALASAAVSLASTPAAAQNFPFPSRKPVMGLTTNVLTTHELKAQYDLWKSRFVERCNQGDARIRYPESGNDTRSEGVGYGMVIAAYFGDQQTFDGLWDYYQRASQNGLMN